MDSSYWRQKWESGDIGFNQAKPHSQLVKHGSVLPVGRVMVPLCGKTVDMLWLRSRGYEVVGIELSALACEAFFSENGVSCERRSIGPGVELFSGGGFELWCGDLFHVPAAAWKGCQGLYDRAALIALPEEVRRQYAAHILRMGASQIKAGLLITVEYQSPALIGPPFSVTESEVRKLWDERFKITRVAQRQDEGLSQRSPKFAEVVVTEAVYRLE